MEFTNSILSFLFILPVVLVFLFFKNKTYNKTAFLKSSFVKENESIITTKKLIKIRAITLFLLKIIVLILFILGALNPLDRKDIQSTKQYGIDMVIALDVSLSMRARDLSKYNRLEVAKHVLQNFIKKRKNDRLGMVIFAADAYVQCPQTLEHEPLLDILKQIKLGTIDGRRTAIGSALAVSASRLLKSKAKSKIIILLTDGVDNAIDKITPEAASEAVAELGIKIYTIGIGRPGKAKIDFELLKNLATNSGGRFYMAGNTKSFISIMNEIDSLEKTLIARKKYKQVKEYSLDFLKYGMFLLLAVMVLEYIVLPLRF